mmetsp:Transcript_24538/g.63360  ORF Transcript_24538/g.63360 Transcript_24538/m.63360 type:complete len:343 (-) Transcript_24538:535-1563(-)
MRTAEPGSRAHSSCLGAEHSWQKMNPHARQWCRRRKMWKSREHVVHDGASRSSSQRHLAASPKPPPSGASASAPAGPLARSELPADGGGGGRTPFMLDSPTAELAQDEAPTPSCSASTCPGAAGNEADGLSGEPASVGIAASVEPSRSIAWETTSAVRAMRISCAISCCSTCCGVCRRCCTERQVKYATRNSWRNSACPWTSMPRVPSSPRTASSSVSACARSCAAAAEASRAPPTTPASSTCDAGCAFGSGLTGESGHKPGWSAPTLASASAPPPAARCACPAAECTESDDSDAVEKMCPCDEERSSLGVHEADAEESLSKAVVESEAHGTSLRSSVARAL